MSRIAMTLHGARKTPYGDALGSISIDEFTEGFHVTTGFWDLGDYQEQWKRALAELKSGAAKGCLITSLDDPAVVGGTAFLWVFYRDGPDVVLQNILLLLDDCQPRFVPSEATKWVPDRETVSEDGERISEWRVRFADLEAVVTLTFDE